MNLKVFTQIFIGHIPLEKANLYRSFFSRKCLYPNFLKYRKGNVRKICSECFNTLKSFQKDKTPGNDGLTVEFYLAFWPILGKHLVTSFNCAHNYGELSNSQKQAVITLVTKGKDKRLIKNWRPVSLIRHQNSF